MNAGFPSFHSMHILREMTYWTSSLTFKINLSTKSLNIWPITHNGALDIGTKELHVSWNCSRETYHTTTNCFFFTGVYLTRSIKSIKWYPLSCQRVSAAQNERLSKYSRSTRTCNAVKAVYDMARVSLYMTLVRLLQQPSFMKHAIGGFTEKKQEDLKDISKSPELTRMHRWPPKVEQTQNRGAVAYIIKYAFKRPSLNDVWSTTNNDKNGSYKSPDQDNTRNNIHIFNERKGYGIYWSCLEPFGDQPMENWSFRYCLHNTPVEQGHYYHPLPKLIGQLQRLTVGEMF